jgi:hypothetical protein
MDTLGQVISSTHGLRKRAFDHDSSTHQHLLDRLWQASRPGVRLSTSTSSSRISTDWQELGFQGRDPATDLRAGGLLGLHMLTYMAERYSAQTKDLLMLQSPVSHTGGTVGNCAPLPFALTGINITVLAVELMEKVRGSVFVCDCCRLNLGLPNSE